MNNSNLTNIRTRNLIKVCASLDKVYDNKLLKLKSNIKAYQELLLTSAS